TAAAGDRNRVVGRASAQSWIALAERVDQLVGRGPQVVRLVAVHADFQPVSKDTLPLIISVSSVRRERDHGVVRQLLPVGRHADAEHSAFIVRLEAGRWWVDAADLIVARVAVAGLSGRGGRPIAAALHLLGGRSLLAGSPIA